MDKAKKIIREWKEKKDPNECLDLHNLDLKELPEIPKECKILDCSLNKLAVLPNCKGLYCSKNNLTKLPDLSNCLELYCTNNRYLYISYEVARKFNLNETVNFFRFAFIIQRNYKVFIRNKYLKALLKEMFLIDTLCPIVCSYLY